VCASAHAETYTVIGRVYTALPTAGTVPTHPLTSTPTDQILSDPLLAEGVHLYPTQRRNFVRVSAETAASGSPLASFLVRFEGAYNLTFSVLSPQVQVRLRVRDAINGAELFASAPLPLVPGTTRRFLLVRGDAVETGGTLAPIPSGQFLVTRVDKVERQLISSTTGLATVPAADAARLGIPEYQGSPFGGRLLLFGAVSPEIYPSAGVGTHCYKLFRAALPGGTPIPITDILEKTRYTLVGTGAGATVTAETVRVGPLTIGAATNCYAFTPPSQPGGIFWGFPDQLAAWSTAGLNGLHQVSVKLFSVATGAEQPLVSAPTLTLRLDNTALNFGLAELKLLNANDSVSSDLLGAGSCDIVQLSGSRKLRARYNARHDQGLLDSLSFTARSNSGASVDLNAACAVVGAPDATHGTPPAGTTVTCTATAFPGTCAYIFTLNARAKTTDGYFYTQARWDVHSYYVLVP
jgi:hypothetical protein